MSSTTSQTWYPISNSSSATVSPTVNSSSNISTTSTISNKTLTAASGQFNNIYFTRSLSGGNYSLTAYLTENNAAVKVGTGSNFPTSTSMPFSFTVSNGLVIPIAKAPAGTTATLTLAGLNLSVTLTFYNSSFTSIPLTQAFSEPSSAYLQANTPASYIYSNIIGIITETTSTGTNYYFGEVSCTINTALYCNNSVDIITNGYNYVNLNSTSESTSNTGNMSLIATVSGITIGKPNTITNCFPFLTTTCPTSGAIAPYLLTSPLTLTPCSSITGTLVIGEITTYNNNGTGTCTSFSFTPTSSSFTGPNSTNNYNLPSSVSVSAINFDAVSGGIQFFLATTTGTTYYFILG